MSRPRLLDLFCGGGGAAMGYYRAGFDVVGVDVQLQPEYPFAFVQGDALEYVAAHGREYDAIHASPPCQPYTSLRGFGRGAGRDIPELVEPTRAALEPTGVPWVMENIVGSPLSNPVILCGSSFGLAVRRHRLFESSHLLFGLPCRHAGLGRPIAVYGDHPSVGDRTNTYRVNRAQSLAEGQVAMGIDWMPWRPLTQAIPPAYTEWLGGQLIRAAVPA